MGCDEKKSAFIIVNKICKLYQEETLAIMQYPDQHKLLDERSDVNMCYKHCNVNFPVTYVTFHSILAAAYR